MKFAYLAAAAVYLFSTDVLADDCQALANTTMCVEETNSFGGHGFFKATFGQYDPLFKSGPVNLGQNTGTYECTGNNFAKINYFTTTGDRGTWIAIADRDGKFLAGTAYDEPDSAYMYYKGRRIKPTGICDPDTGPK